MGGSGVWLQRLPLELCRRAGFERSARKGRRIMTTKTSAVEIRAEAGLELQKAVNALDMAHALLKDIDWHKYVSTKTWGRYVTLKEAVEIADGLLRDIQNIECPECGKPMGESEDCLSGHCPELEKENN